MKNEESGSKNWDDLVFENRNQEYGAYAIRKSYSENVLSGTFVSVTLAALVLLVPLLSSFKEKEVVKDGPDCRLPIVLTEPPIIVPLHPPVAPPPPPAAANINLPPRVTTDSTDVVLPTVDQIAAAHPVTDGGVDGGVVSPSAGTDIVEPPAIVEPSVLITAEVMPEYEGGMAEMYRFIQRKLKYPPVPRRMEIEGTVFVSFVVDATGGIADVKVLRGAHVDLDKEAARVISLLPGWTPGRQHNRNVAVRMTLPIKFQLNH